MSNGRTTAVAEPCLEDALNDHERFEEAINSSHALALEEFTARCEELLTTVAAKKEEFDDYFSERTIQLEVYTAAFSEARQDAIAAAEHLQSVQAELDAHRAQGQQQLGDIKACLKDLLASVKGATFKHLLLGSTLVILHVGILGIAAKRRERS